ncbi:MAG TPA: radical SAM protein [Candidatus Acidoferrales bacterium]|nr:radical SAM protein [Candidatus Acidoferrales bacterium]
MQTQATYGEFSARIHKSSHGTGNGRIPVEASIEVTRRCPLECLHCYNNLPMNDRAARSEELTLEEHRRLLDELAEAGCLWLLYTGGEVFARADFPEIYRSAKAKGFLITIFTNGTLITPRVADMLAEWRPFGIEITLYGATRETYEALTQIPGSYERCMRGVRLLVERGLPLKLKTVPTTVNLHEVYAMKRFAEEDLGVEFKFDPLVNPRIDCSASPLGVRLSPEEVVALDFHDAQREGEYRRMATAEASMDRGMNVEAGHVYFCGGGMTSLAVDPAGRMSICVLSQRETYDWRRGSLREAWENFFPRVRLKPKTRPTKCDACRIQSLCGMCPANGELENGDPEEPVEFLCQVAHLRAEALGLAVPEHGACAFCTTGARHAEVARAAARIRQREINVGEWTPRLPALPILGSSGAAGGCGSGHCGSCVAHS